VSGDQTDQAEMCASGRGDWLLGPRFRGEQYAVSAMLRQTFEGIAAEPLPGRIVELLRQLDAPSAQPAEATGGQAGNQSEPRTLRP
jgi:hypothetical protein